MKTQLNKLRNNALNAAIAVLAKAKAKPADQRLRQALNDSDLSDAEKIRVLNMLQKRIKEKANA
jgi:hypothetical protein